jgi:predicted ribosome quality control (RQC) complex YloA/Tae2 family protein
MHNNFYFLRQLSHALNERLKNCVVSECFSQNRDELVLRFETFNKPFYIKASLLPAFSCLSFPDNFQRARKNSVDLFKALIGQRIVSVRQFENERSFALQFTNNMALLFKMHGNRSNLILFENDIVIDLFKNSLEQDARLNIQTLDRSIDWSYENFQRNADKLQHSYFTFGKTAWLYLNEQGFSEKDDQHKWETILHLKQLLENPKYYVAQVNDDLALLLFPFGKTVKTFDDPILAVTDFYFKYTHTFAFEKEKANALSHLKNKWQASNSYIEKTKQKLKEILDDSHYKIWADLVMANLHAIKPGSEKISVENFYNENRPIEIKLKKDLSPQRNAEIFYRKSKNQQIEIDRLKQAISAKENEVDVINDQIAKINQATDLKSLRALVGSLGIQTEKVKQEESLPYHIIEFKDYVIWVGKNAKANDVLTLKYAFKEDLWLHAKDVAGSHVVIKYKSGKNFPKDVIERAAQLAAYYSKRKTETLCPVAVTPKKFVRKRKGDPPGAVVVEREEVIMVEPKN